MSEVSAIGFSYRTILDKNNRREVVFQSHIAVDATREEIDSILDKMGQAATRQAAIYELEEAERAYADHLRNLQACEAQLAMMDETYRLRWEAAGKRGGFALEKLPASERQQRSNALQSVAQWRTGLQRWHDDVERLRPLVNGNASYERSDNYAGLPSSQNTGNGAASRPKA